MRNDNPTIERLNAKIEYLESIYGNDREIRDEALNLLERAFKQFVENNDLEMCPPKHWANMANNFFNSLK